jgi:hypothetical protein
LLAIQSLSADFSLALRLWRRHHLLRINLHLTLPLL